MNESTRYNVVPEPWRFATSKTGKCFSGQPDWPCDHPFCWGRCNCGWAVVVTDCMTDPECPECGEPFSTPSQLKERNRDIFDATNPEPEVKQESYPPVYLRPVTSRGVDYAISCLTRGAGHLGIFTDQPDNWTDEIRMVIAGIQRERDRLVHLLCELANHGGEPMSAATRGQIKEESEREASQH